MKRSPLLGQLVPCSLIWSTEGANLLCLLPEFRLPWLTTSLTGCLLKRDVLGRERQKQRASLYRGLPVIAAPSVPPNFPI